MQGGTLTRDGGRKKGTEINEGGRDDERKRDIKDGKGLRGEGEGRGRERDREE